jgi:uncharacterized Ntn-hydrolase superfamily protein
MRWVAVLAVCSLLCAGAGGEESDRDWPATSTFSIAGYDPVTGDLGVAVQSKFLGVGAVVPFARAKVGAIATQAWANTTYGPQGLELLSRGAPAPEVIRRLVKADPERERRQIGVVTAKGLTAAFTGQKTNAWSGHITGRHFAAQGNILAGERVVQDMARAFQGTQGDLSGRLLAALEAGQAAGGDIRGQQSAALLVVRDRGGYSGFNDRFIDIRVDDHPRPIEELRRILRLWERTFGRAARLESAARFEKAGNKKAAQLERERAQQ